MISVEEARSRILAALAADAGRDACRWPQAWGRVLAAPGRWPALTQPPADVSAMDGYALRAAEALAGASLDVIGSAPAGHPFAGAVGPGEAVRHLHRQPRPAGRRRHPAAGGCRRATATA